MPSKLYVIATPIGNIEDTTLRAIKVLGELKVLFAEDTREVRKLLDLLKVPASGKEVFSYAKHNMGEANARALKALASGLDVGFVSDRGTPGISDPGNLLVGAARQAGHDVLPIPGASAVAALASICGWELFGFQFVGFLPQTPKARGEILGPAILQGTPFCLYESPQRIRETVTELKTLLPGARYCFGREMTKQFEEYREGLLEDLDPASLREQGEYSFFVKPQAAALTAEEEVSHVEIAVHEKMAGDKDWSRLVSKRIGISAKVIYDALQREKRV